MLDASPAQTNGILRPFSARGAGEGAAARPAALVFKGGEAASLHKPKKNKKPASNAPADADAEAAAPASAEGAEGGVAGAGDDYTIDAAKRMKYEELFPVESKKFGYDPANAARTSCTRTVEEALDDRVRKKADRYCK